MIKGILTNRGLEINISELLKKYDSEGLKKIQNKFIIRYKSPIGNFYITKLLYFKHDNIIIFPRFLGFKLLNLKIIDKIENNILKGEHIELNYIGKSNQNQINIINHIFENIYTHQNIKLGKAGLTLKVLAGFGKSFIAMDLISRINKKTLIIVPNTYLLKQWVELLTKYFPNNTIGEYYGKNKRDGNIIVGIINSLISDEFILKDHINKKIKYTYSYDNFFNQFDFIILDESHIYCTDIFKVIYNRFQSTYMLGLSATPDERNNKCDLISHAHIGEVLDAHQLPNFIHSDIKFQAEVNIIKYNAPDEYIKVHINPTTNMICVPQMIEDLINDEYRNKLILNELLNLFDLKLNIFVFSERRNHLEYLYNEFNCLLEEKYTNLNTNNLDTVQNNNNQNNTSNNNSQNNTSNNNSENNNLYKDYISVPELNINNNLVLYGGSSDEDIQNAKDKSNVIFTTYSYSSTGVSIDKMNAVILSTPRKSKAKQIIGRIFRLNKQNNHIKRIIIDIVDNKTILKNQLYSRMDAYKERDSTIIKKNINYNEINL
jgi:superfamily II DNA or RNA helicase